MLYLLAGTLSTLSTAKMTDLGCMLISIREANKRPIEYRSPSIRGYLNSFIV